MDIVKALNVWLSLGDDYTTESVENDEGYFCYFLHKGQRVGFVKAKQGFYWNYPQELMNIAHEYDRGGRKL